MKELTKNLFKKGIGVAMKRNYLTRLLTMLALTMSLIVLPCLSVCAKEFPFNENLINTQMGCTKSTGSFASRCTGDTSPWLKIQRVTSTGYYYAGNYVNNKEMVMNRYKAVANFTEGQIIKANLALNSNKIVVKGIENIGTTMYLDFVRVQIEAN